jgi:argininosuccinate synthase
MSKNKILLAFSGGLDTSAIVPWLRETYHADIIAYCADLGNAPDYNFLKNRAAELGATEFIFEDVRDLFVSKFVWPMLRSGATYQDDYLLGTAIARPLIAERMALFAKKYGATAVAHGATGKGNDQLRFEKSLAYLVPQLEIIAPWKIWDFKGRQDLIDYITSRGYSYDAKKNLYSEDVNLLHRSCEGGILENIQSEYNPHDIYEWVSPSDQRDNKKTLVKINFEQGIPVAVNGQMLSPVALLTQLNEIAGKAGIGVLDLVEERTIGIKSRGVYETPGGTLVHFATKAMKHMCWDRQLLTIGRQMAQVYGEMVYDGLWHSDSRHAIDAFFSKAAESLHGSITLCLDAGQIRIAERESIFSLYSSNAVTFEGDEQNIHHYADGYSRIARLTQWRGGQRAERMANFKAATEEAAAATPNEGKSASSPVTKTINLLDAEA